MQFSKKMWLMISGATWMAIGIMLLVKGLKFIVTISETSGAVSPLLNWFVPLVGARQQAGLLLISAGLFLGFIKGRVVLVKTVKRISARIPEGSSKISQVYDRKYYVILAVMVGIGMTFRFLPIPLDLRGVIDVTIGSALINGAMLYFRETITCDTCSRG
ncbi:MAG TPA: hypothetical protein PKW79_01945 [Rhabdochlamydiaceae bacterium]|nr:hypothetical protein [Rhabdochlamydiaceae bacterium]